MTDVTVALAKFKEMYACDPKAQQHLRLGQLFCNLFIDEPWSELYYEADDAVAESLISGWLRDHQYTDTLPEPFDRIQLPH
jgi:hypothetical protein